jgi:hypothetical protein
MSGNEMAAAAHGYARQGFPVFPLVPNGKTPLTAHGHLDASMSGADITEWWSQWPDANIGIACGEQSFDVLDVDTKRKVDGRHVPDSRAMDYLSEVVKAGWLRGAWRTVTTPSGGLHFYFRGTSGQRPGKTCNGPDGTPWPFDFRTTGGYVAVPPSAVNGAAYKIHEDIGLIRARVFDWQAFKLWLWTPPAPQPISGQHFGGDSSTVDFGTWFVDNRPPGTSRHDSLFRLALTARRDGTHGTWDWYRQTAAAVYQGEPGRHDPLEIERIITTVKGYYS